MLSHGTIDMKDKGFDEDFACLESQGKGKREIQANCRLGKKSMRLPEEHLSNKKYWTKPFTDRRFQGHKNGLSPVRINIIRATDRDAKCNDQQTKKNQGYLNLTPIASPHQICRNHSKSKRKYKIFGGPSLPIAQAQQQQKSPTGFLQNDREKHEKWVHLHQIGPKSKCKQMLKDRISRDCQISHTYNAPSLDKKSKTKLKFGQTQPPYIPQLKMKYQSSIGLHQTPSLKSGLLSTHLSTPRDILGNIQPSSTQRATYLEYFDEVQSKNKEDIRKERENSDLASNIEQFDSESQYPEDQSLQIFDTQLQKQQAKDPHQLFFPNTLFQGLRPPKQKNRKKATGQIYYQNILDRLDLNQKQPVSNPLKLFTYIPIVLILLSCLLFFIQSR